jgi:futalosine hydrolase
MTKLLLVSATAAEIEPTLFFLSQGKDKSIRNFILGNLSIDVCITGVGMVNTAFELGRLEHKNYNIAINVGVAGAFNKIKLGEVVNVSEDCFSELGAEDGERFLSIDELGFGKQNLKIENPFQSSTTNDLQKVRGITVNTVHGNDTSIKRIKEKYNPGIESMEGAAFIHAANSFRWQALQIRAISNKVEKRNRENWDLPLAIKNLNDVILRVIRIGF